jgi:hypothetical protein
MSALRDLLHTSRSPISVGQYEEEEFGEPCRQLCAFGTFYFTSTSAKKSGGLLK